MRINSVPSCPQTRSYSFLHAPWGKIGSLDEFILRFTHTLRMDWFAPGVEPTGKRLEVSHVAVIQFEEGKITSEHIYWDQATVLVQLGLLDAANLPVLGAEQVDRLTDTSAPANQLIDRLNPASD